MTDHLLPGGVLVASIMSFRQAGEPLESGWERSAVGESDGVKFRRVARSHYDPQTEFEHTEDLYQKIAGEQVFAEELYRRSPATRSFHPAQIKALFEKAGLGNVQLFSGFTFEPMRPGGNLFVIIGQK